MPTRFPWRAAAAAVLVVVVVGAGVVLVPRALRSHVIDEAARRGVTLTLGTARLGWRAVELEDVGVALEGVDGLDVHFATLRVAVDARLRPTSIDARGGRMTVRGAETLRSQLEGWRGRRSPTGAVGGRAPSVELQLEVASMT